jgi:hypothetical protein
MFDRMIRSVSTFPQVGSPKRPAAREFDTDRADQVEIVRCWHGFTPAQVPGKLATYSAATTSFPRGVIRNTSIEAARHASPLARNASR